VILKIDSGLFTVGFWLIEFLNITSKVQLISENSKLFGILEKNQFFKDIVIYGFL
jgi:hypothetical protein